MPATKRSVLSTNPHQRPHDLHQKYRKLAIPAVVAAVSAEKSKMKDAPKRQSNPQDDDHSG